MAVSGVGSGFVFRSTSQKKDNTKKEDGGTFGDILEASERSSNDPLTTQEMMREIRDRMGEIYDKVKKGQTQPSFQIGASSFTLKEWERFLKKFDKGQEELEEMIREAKQEQQKKMAALAPEGNDEWVKTV